MRRPSAAFCALHKKHLSPGEQKIQAHKTKINVKYSSVCSSYFAQASIIDEKVMTSGLTPNSSISGSSSVARAHCKDA
jgi:hypothetical protein